MYFPAVRDDFLGKSILRGQDHVLQQDKEQSPMGWEKGEAGGCVVRIAPAQLWLRLENERIKGIPTGTLSNSIKKISLY